MSRPTRAVVDLACLRHNLQAIRHHIGPVPAIMVPVKADAYGHGAISVARVCEGAGIDMLAVATVEEGLELRRAGIRLPILLLGTILPAEAPHVLDGELTASVSDRTVAAALSVAANDRGCLAPVFVNVDTGMGRVGFCPCSEAASFIVEIASLRSLRIMGVFSHFPSSDEEDKALAHRQIRLFRHIRASVERAGIDVPYWSMANSGAVCDIPESHFNLVRPGIMVYGHLPSRSCVAPLTLEPAMSLRSAIVFIKRVDRGTPLGYGGTYKVPRDKSLVATVPVGYADGYSRGLSNRAPVLVNGRRYRISGRVSMDQITIDLGPEGSASVGDEVVLFGSQGDASIEAEEIADLLDTIVYEITCAVSKRVPRVWVNGE